MPSYSASKIVYDHVADDGTYYLIGEPSSLMGEGNLQIDNNRNRVMIWRLDLNPDQDCPTIQSFAIDFMVPQYHLLKMPFWGKILDLEIDEDGMTAQVAVAETNDPTRLGLLGSDNVGILSARFERELKCKTKNTFKTQTATRTFPGIKDIYTKMTPANQIFKQNGEAEGFGKTRSIRVWGRISSSLELSKYY